VDLNTDRWPNLVNATVNFRAGNIFEELMEYSTGSY